MESLLTRNQQKIKQVRPEDPILPVKRQQWIFVPCRAPEISRCLNGSKPIIEDSVLSVTTWLRSNVRSARLLRLLYFPQTASLSSIWRYRSVASDMQEHIVNLVPDAGQLLVTKMSFIRGFLQTCWPYEGWIGCLSNPFGSAGNTTNFSWIKFSMSKAVGSMGWVLCLYRRSTYPVRSTDPG